MTRLREAVTDRARELSNQSRRRFDRVARRAADLIMSRYPRTLGVVVNGSVGRGEPLPYSDVDIMPIKRNRLSDTGPQQVCLAQEFGEFRLTQCSQRELRFLHNPSLAQAQYTVAEV